jgi:hypothetical protein
MSHDQILQRYFPTVRTETQFVQETARELHDFGFTADNTIAIVDVCRDEISQSLLRVVRDEWGEAFNLCALAGLFFAGRTALVAAMHHAPRQDGRERFAFFTLPHIAIDGEGRLGVCERPGVGESNACGALNVFLQTLRQGTRALTLDENDLEQSLLTLRLFKELRGASPDLLQLTRVVQKVALTDLEAALQPLIAVDRCDYTVLSGIQIHGPDGNYVSPIAGYAVVGGARHEIVRG